MKKFLFVIFLSLVLASCHEKKDKISPDLIDIPESANSSNSKGNMPVMTFEKDVHDFGRLSEGEKISYSFKFTNTGKSDLVISQVTSGCGCTIADFPKDIIKPKQNGYITVTFSSSGKQGQQNQVVSIYANTQPSINYVTIRAQVVSAN